MSIQEESLEFSQDFEGLSQTLARSPPAFGSLIDADHSLMHSSQQIQPSQDARSSNGRVVPALLPARNSSIMALSSRVRDGKNGKVITVYTSENIMTRSTNRTRVGALKFHDRDHRDDFIQSLLERISNAKGARGENFGFDVRSCTFVVDGGFLWVIFISLAALSYNKWHKLFMRFRALDVKVPFIHAGTQASLDTAADMFDGLTDIEQLTQNHIICEVDDEALQKVRGKKRQAPGSSAKTAEPAVSKRTEASEPAPDKTARTGEPAPKKTARTGEPAPKKTARTSEPAPEKTSESVAWTADDEAADLCLAFLTSAEFPSVEKHHAFLLQYIQSSVAHGQIGFYLLSRRPVELYARVVQLRTVVVRTLQEMYSIDARVSLGTASLLWSGRFESIPLDSQAALRLVGECMDHGRDVPVFALIDVGLILTLVSIHVVNQGLEKGLREFQFMDGYKFVVAEQIWWLVMLGCRLSQFLSLEMARGYVLQVGEGALLFPNASDEWENLLESVSEFPALQAILRSHGQRSFSLKARYKFHKTKPAVALARIKQAHGIDAFGRAVQAFEKVHDRSSWFYGVLADSPLYRALPATKYTDDPARHVEGFGDTEALVRLFDERSPLQALAEACG